MNSQPRIKEVGCLFYIPFNLIGQGLSGFFIGVCCGEEVGVL